MVEAALLQLSWPLKSFHGYPLPPQDGATNDAFMFRTLHQRPQDPDDESSSPFHGPLRTGKELGETAPPERRGLGEPLALNAGPVLFPTLCDITPASWA